MVFSPARDKKHDNNEITATAKQKAIENRHQEVPFKPTLMPFHTEAAFEAGSWVVTSSKGAKKQVWSWDRPMVTKVPFVVDLGLQLGGRWLWSAELNDSEQAWPQRDFPSRRRGSRPST